MGDVLRDVNKHITGPILNKVNDQQKSLRRKMAGMIDVTDDEPKNSGNVFENEADDSAKIDKDSFSLESLRHWDVAMPPAKKKQETRIHDSELKEHDEQGNCLQQETTHHH